MDVTLFRNEGVADVIKLRYAHNELGRALTQYVCCPDKEKLDRNTRNKWHVMSQAETGVLQLTAKACPRIDDHRQKHATLCLRRSGPADTFDSDLQN